MFGNTVEERKHFFKREYKQDETAVKAVNAMKIFWPFKGSVHNKSSPLSREHHYTKSKETTYFSSSFWELLNYIKLMECGSSQ